MNAADICRAVVDTGAYSCACIRAGAVADAAVELYNRYLEAGHQAEMTYLERYGDVRADVRRLLDAPVEEATLAVALYSYGHPSVLPRQRGPRIADYALGRDYHKVLRKRLAPVARAITEATGYEARVCVDTAPLRERYWAAAAGLGFIGLNNQLTEPGVGAHFFIASIVIGGAVEGAALPQTPTSLCGDCRRCVEACPTRALDGSGACHTERCLSYLTIERRTPLDDGTPLAGNLYGCDICRRVCPHSHGTPQDTPLADFSPRPALLALNRDAWQAMTPQEYDLLTQGSAMRRTTLPHLQHTLSLQ